MESGPAAHSPIPRRAKTADIAVVRLLEAPGFFQLAFRAGQRFGPCSGQPNSPLVRDRSIGDVSTLGYHT
jgi:hypothetical protein